MRAAGVAQALLACLAAAWHRALAGEVVPLTTPDFKALRCEARGKSPPVTGTFVELPLWDDSEGLGRPRNSTGQTGWDFLVKTGDSTCRHGVWPRENAMDCLKGTWTMVIGASSANIWMVQLVNALVPGGLLTKRDGFNIDGVWTQMIDVVIQNGKVEYLNVVVDELRDETHDRRGSHSYVRSSEKLRNKFKQVTDATAFSPDAIRITHFVAEYWDEVELALDAVQTGSPDWEQAESAVVLSVGLWYLNAVNCKDWDDWCVTRPSLLGRDQAETIEEFERGMDRALTALEPFCALDGRAGRRGCIVTSIDHCSFMEDDVWQNMHRTVKDTMAERGSEQIRFLDVWALTTHLGLDCIGEHQSPVSTLWTWQILLSSMCDPSLAAPGTVAAFKGEGCWASQAASQCKKFEDKGFKYEWECALSEPCEVQAYGADEFAREDYDACTDYMAVTGCSWTKEWSCRGQPLGSEGATEDDGSVGFRCCCLYSLWDEQRFEEARTTQERKYYFG
jgi:hypothetical protein